MTYHPLVEAISPAATAAGSQVGLALGSNLGLLATGGNPIGMYYGGLAGSMAGGAIGGAAGMQLQKLAHKIHVSSDEKIRDVMRKNMMRSRTRRYK